MIPFKTSVLILKNHECRRNKNQNLLSCKYITSIIRIATYEKLHNFHMEIVTNSTYFQLNIGGFQFVHLGFVLGPSRYAMEYNETYTCPMHPVVL